jgi:hypothetical protein
MALRIANLEDDATLDDAIKTKNGRGCFSPRLIIAALSAPAA